MNIFTTKYDSTMQVTPGTATAKNFDKKNYFTSFVY